jgi:AcrR family transcriptional regulator
MTGPAGRPRRPRDSLNREVILDAALRIAERDGLDGLTFLALGQELGAHATSVYRHFRDKDGSCSMIDEPARSYGLHAERGRREDLRSRASHPGYLLSCSATDVHAVHPAGDRVRNVEFADALRAGLVTGRRPLRLGNYVRAMASHEAAVGP